MLLNPIGKHHLLFGIEMLRKAYRGTDEAIPTYTAGEIDEVHSCMERVYAGYSETPEERVAAAMFNIAKGHYLSNGNKRVAVVIATILYREEVGATGPMNTVLLKRLVLGVAEGSVSKEDLAGEVSGFSIVGRDGV